MESDMQQDYKFKLVIKTEKIMKKALIILILLVSILNINASGVFKADFNGTWKLDTKRTEGIPPGMEQIMSVVQDGDIIKIETTVKTDKGEQKIPDNYVLNGQEADFTSPNFKNAKGKRTGKWDEDQKGFVINEKVEVETDNGMVTVEFWRKWMLSADGNVLTIDIKIKDPQGEKVTKRTFTKS